MNIPENINIDYSTVAFIKHLIAGKLSNINGGSKMQIGGKTHLSDGKNIAEIINRDGEDIKAIINQLLEQATNK